MFSRIFDRRTALPTDHGTWAFLLSPLLIGLAAGGRWSVASGYLVVASLAGFLLRQPITTLVKILSGRRGEKTLPAVLFWSCLYLVVALLHLVGLALRGYAFVLVLAAPGLVVFAWYLGLVARRDERRQKNVEILGAGVLALAAPAAYWIGREGPDSLGWYLWLLTWIFSTMSIVHVYARLEQRALGTTEPGVLRRPGRRALATNTLLLGAAIALSSASIRHAFLPIPFLIQWAESAQAAFATTAPARPAAIGVRQLVVSALFTLLFVVLWR